MCFIFAHLLCTDAGTTASPEASPAAAPCPNLWEPASSLSFNAASDSLCVRVLLPVSSLAASCLFLMCIFTGADFYFFPGCDISFSTAYRIAKRRDICIGLLHSLTPPVCDRVKQKSNSETNFEHIKCIKGNNKPVI